MIISKTPYRISFFGGGTDYPPWYLKHGGAVISTTIDKYCFLSCRVLPPFFSNKYRIVWSHIEKTSTISEILHPAVREGLRYMGIVGDQGLEIHHQGDLPARAGMGSSSSFAVGLIKALTALRGEIIGKKDLAYKAIELEQSVLKENVGSQDQVAAAYGGFNVISFTQQGDIQIEPVTVRKSTLEALNDRLLLFYTGTSRLSSEVAGDVITNLSSRSHELNTMRKMVDKAVTILNTNKDLDDFGRLLHETWTLKQNLSKMISNTTIKTIYQTAVENGAVGGKLLGAGSSGFVVFYVPPQNQKKVRKALSNYLHVPFRFESEGSTLIHYIDKNYILPESHEAQLRKSA
jgi:D-glycero-alpha-D-manno-heptose-7-phosphate kinase